MKKFKFILTIFFLSVFFQLNTKAEDEKVDAIADQLQIIMKDLKTLEKAVYNSANVTSSKKTSSGLNEEILTRHLLKLNEIEDQFRKLTNRFEEIDFKLDKLSNRVTKIQSDSQIRFSDLESSELTQNKKVTKNKKKK